MWFIRGFTTSNGISYPGFPFLVSFQGCLSAPFSNLGELTTMISIDLPQIKNFQSPNQSIFRSQDFISQSYVATYFFHHPVSSDLAKGNPWTKWMLSLRGKSSVGNGWFPASHDCRKVTMNHRRDVCITLFFDLRMENGGYSILQLCYIVML